MKYGIVSDTVFQGLTMSRGDIYDTKEEADAEQAEMVSELGEDCGYDVIEIVQGQGGRWYDTCGVPISIVEES